MNVGNACYFFAAFFWGLNIPVTVKLFDSFDPYFLAAVRVLIAALVLCVLCVATNGLKTLSMPIAVGRLALLSLALALFFSLYNLGLKYTNPITAAAIMAATPVYTAMTLRLSTGAALQPGFWVAATLSILGTAIAIMGRPDAALSNLSLQGGEILIVLSYVSWNMFSILAQRWFAADVPQLQRTYLAMAAAVLWMTAVWALVLTAGWISAPTLAPSQRDVIYVLVTAVFSTGLGVAAWNLGVKRIGLAAGAVWQNTVPVFGVLIAIAFGIMPTIAQLVGGVIVLTGVIYMNWARAQHGRRTLGPIG
jgi:drug/metabolite transporter (DMT)-like permease